MQQATSRSGKSDMAASNAESWARLRLVQGESSEQKRELLASQGHATLMVGADEQCTWVVQEEGVRPIHFSLHWDGATLRVADVDSAGDVRVDGAPLSSQWRPLLGRVRIEFGKAAMVVETSGGSAVRSDPPDHQPFSLEPETKRSPTASARNVKGTLIGMVPGSVVPNYLQVPSSSESSGSSAPPKSESSRPRSETASLKATLVGGIGIRTPAGGAKPKHNATLMGFNAAEVLRGVVTPSSPPPASGGQPISGSSLGEADQRTVQGFPVGDKASSSAPPSPGSSIPGRRQTQKGVISRPPGVLDGAVTSAQVRTISAGPAAAEGPQQRIGSAWQEIPAAEGFVSDEPAPPAEPEPVVPRAPRAPRGSSASWDIGERLSDIPTQMRDQASFATARRRRRGFPWRYVGVLLLTAVAYFAWLYLLDHL